MSQVRKLLFGDKIPKAQEGYKFNLDGQDIYYSDEDIKEIGDRIAALPVEYRRFFGNAVNAIKSGNQSGNRASNTISMPQLGGLSDRELKKLAKQNPSYWSSLTKDNTYYAKEAINEYLNILHSVANRPKKVEEAPGKTNIGWEELNLDFNEKDKKKYLSTTGNFGAKRRVSDIIKHIQDGESSEYTYDDKYKIKDITDWINGQEDKDKYKAATAYFTNLWNEMESGKHTYDGNVEDLLRLFGINYGLTAPISRETPKDDTDKKEKSSKEESKEPYVIGNFYDGLGYYGGMGADGNPIWTSKRVENNIPFDINPELPTLITPAFAKQLGLDESYNFGLYYNNKPYKPTAIPLKFVPNMEAVAEINNRSIPQAERHKELSKHINIPGANPDNYADWTPGNTLENIDIDSVLKNLGISSAAVSYSPDTLSNGFMVYKYFDNTKPGTNPWNFRPEQWLFFDPNNEYLSQPPEFTANNFNDLARQGTWERPQFIKKEMLWGNDLVWRPKWTNGTKGKEQFKVVKTFKHDESPMGNTPCELLVDKNGDYYVYWLPLSSTGMDRKGRVQKVTKEYADIVVSRNPKYTETNQAIRLAKYGRLKEGGKIDFKKVNALVAKNGGNIVKGQGGLTPEQIQDAVKIAVGGKKYLADLIANQTSTTVPSETATTQSEDLQDLPEVGGGYNYNIPSALKYMSPLISTGRFIETGIAQERDRKYAKDMLNAGRFNELAVWANTPSSDMPILDRQLQQVQMDRMSGVKPVTSNFIDNFAAANMRESQLWDRENNIYTQMSNQYKTIQDQITDIMNKNLENQILTRNRNIERQKAIDAAIIGADREFNQRRDASHQAASLEVQNNIKNDVDYLNRLNEFNFSSKQQDAYDKQIDRLFSGARDQWNNLSAADQAKYGDFDAYLEQSDAWKDTYTKNRAQIDLWKRQMQQRMLDWNVRNKLNYWYPKSVMGSTSTVGMKKGGRLNGKTRYTLEPDERIWIDNNKAAHNAVAKLDDHIIKLLLKALK